MNCTEAKQILMDVALDEAGADEQKRLEAHLVHCADCRAQMHDLVMTHKLVAQGLPLEESPQRIAFVAPAAATAWTWRELFRPAFVASVTAFATALLVAGMLTRPVAVPTPVSVTATFTRDQVAQMITAAVRESEERQRVQTAELLKAASQRLERGQYARLTSIAEQIHYLDLSQKDFYRQQEGTRAALVAMSMERGERQ